MESQAFWQGIEQFNQGEYYACHDTLEALWMEATEPDKTFCQGILQIAVALYHLGNGNNRGAAILLGEGMNRLRRYLPDYYEVDVAHLIGQAESLLNLLQLHTLQHPNSAASDPVVAQLDGTKLDKLSIHKIVKQGSDV